MSVGASRWYNLDLLTNNLNRLALLSFVSSPPSPPHLPTPHSPFPSEIGEQGAGGRGQGVGENNFNSKQIFSLYANKTHGSKLSSPSPPLPTPHQEGESIRVICEYQRLSLRLAPTQKIPHSPLPTKESKATESDYSSAYKALIQYPGNSTGHNQKFGGVDITLYHFLIHRLGNYSQYQLDN